MAVRLFIYSMSVVFLTSCFLGQNKPPSTQTSPFEGLVVLEDMRGALVEELLEVDPTASIWAQFVEKESSSRGAVRMSGRGIYPAARKVTEDEDVKCEFYTFQRGTRENYRAMRSGYLSLGELSFGSSMQSSFMVLDQGEDNQYKKELEPDFPAGEYLIVAEGAGNVKGFKAYLGFPERLLDVTGNGSPFDSSVVVIRKDEDIEFSWRAPAIPNSKSYIMMDLKYEDDGKEKMFSCLTIESLYDEGKSDMKWIIPKEKFAEVPAVETALVFFHRLFVDEPKDPDTGTIVQLQGWRTYWGVAQVID